MPPRGRGRGRGRGGHNNFKTGYTPGGSSNQSEPLFTAPAVPLPTNNFGFVQAGTKPNQAIEVIDDSDDDDIVEIVEVAPSTKTAAPQKGKKPGTGTNTKNEAKNEAPKIIVPKGERKREKRKIYLNQEILDRIHGKVFEYESEFSIMAESLPKLPKIDKDKLTHMTFDSVWSKNTMTIPEVFGNSQKFYDNENWGGVWVLFLWLKTRDLSTREKFFHALSA